MISALFLALSIFAVEAATLVKDSFGSVPGPLVGTMPSVGSMWTAIDPDADRIQVVPGSLAAPPGLLPSSGGKLAWAAGGEDASMTFASQTSGTIYYRLLVRPLTITPSTAGTNLAGLGSGAGTWAASVGLRKDPSDATKYNIGFFSRQTSMGPLFSDVPLAAGTTHLVVISYTFVPGPNNDIVKLWLNPTSFGGSEPPPTISLVHTGGDIASLGQFFLRQRDSNTPSVEIDELLVATTWAEVTPPSGTPPAISSHPLSQSVNSESTAQFSVAATGMPFPTYQWRKDGINIVGATSGTLTIANAGVSDGGVYDVIVTNFAGTATSNPATLTVYVGQSKANTTVPLNAAGSWLAGIVPGAAHVAKWDSIVTAARTAAIGGNVSFNGIQVTNPGGTQTIDASSGFSLTLGTQGIDMSGASADLTVLSAIHLGSPQTWSVALGRALSISPGSGISNTGTSALLLTGPGRLKLGNGSTYFGSGTVSIGGNIDIGSSNSATRTISNPVIFAGDFSVTSTSTNSTGAVSFAGDLSVGGATRTATLVSPGGSATQPAFSLGGGSGKTFTGNGKLALVNGNPGGLPMASVCLQGGVTIQTGLQIGNAVSVFVMASNVFDSPETLTVDSGGIFNMARATPGPAYSQKVGAIGGAGTITSNATNINSAATLTIDGGTRTDSTTFSGQITNSNGAVVSIHKKGATMQILTGSNTYSGSTTVSGGVLRLGNSSPIADFLPEGTLCSLQAGGTLDLDFASAAVQEGVGALAINGVNKPKGLYGPVGSGAEFETSLITGTGRLRVGIITAQPVGSVVNAGNSVVFTVSAVAAPTPSFQWKKNGLDIEGATGSSLSIDDVQLSDAADYTVLVTNANTSQLSAVAPLVVMQAPAITAQPLDVTTVDGVTASFSVTVTGYPAPTFQWKRNGVDIPGATSAYFDLTCVMPTDAGAYSVVITNSQGSTTSNVSTLVVNSSPYVVNAQLGDQVFSWTFSQPVTRGYFVDGMPWIVRPAGGVDLTAVSPARKNNQSVTYWTSGTTSDPCLADIDITVINPPFDHTFDGSAYVNNPNGVFGWDSRAGGIMRHVSSPKYNPQLGWNGTSPVPLAVGDSITTAKSTIQDLMPSRSTPLDYLAVLTVLAAPAPVDAFRPGVIRSGTDRTNPEILKYSDLIDLDPFLIASPVGKTDLRGVAVNAISPLYQFGNIGACLIGPGFINTGLARSEGVSALLNNYADPYDGTYGGTVGNHMGELAIGTLASWLTESERRDCRIRYIQRAIDAYSAVKAGVCLEEGAGVLPGYSTLITVAGVMMNHPGMKSVNNGVNGVKPWLVFADYACHYHAGNVPAGDLSTGETQADRGIPLYSATTTDYPELNRKDVQPIAVAATDTMTMKTDFYWGNSRPMNSIINLKLRVTGGAGAGSTIYVISDLVVTGVTEDEKFRTTASGTTTFSGSNGQSGNVYGYEYGGKVKVKPAWQNGIPDSDSVLAFSITTSDPHNPASDDGAWFWRVDGVIANAKPVKMQNVLSVSTSPTAAYAAIHAAGTIDNLIVLYALGQQSLYKGGVDKYLIRSGSLPGHGEVLFAGGYLNALGSGSTGNTRGALWKHVVLAPLGKSFVYTGQGTSALDVPHPHAKMWYEP